jgi:hypothetical protein
MNDRFIACLADTLLPGDDGPPPLPCASEIRVDRALATRVAADDGTAYRRALMAVARAAGDAHTFVRATGEVRSAAVAAAERAAPDELRAVVVLLFEAYYQSEPVIRAMGWRPQSPQPLGHPVEPLDVALLEPVKARAPMWKRG